MRSESATQAYWRRVGGRLVIVETDIAFYSDAEPQMTKFIARDSYLVPETAGSKPRDTGTARRMCTFHMR
jgi:hypothetical protein